MLWSCITTRDNHLGFGKVVKMDGSLQYIINIREAWKLNVGSKSVEGEVCGGKGVAQEPPHFGGKGVAQEPPHFT